MMDAQVVAGVLAAKSIPEPNSGCLLWFGALNGSGYGRLRVKRGGTQKMAHRVAWELASGKSIPFGMCVCHKCDVRCCINPNHLFIGSTRENNIDRHQKRRESRGVRHGDATRNSQLFQAVVRSRRGQGNLAAKLTEDQARIILDEPGMHREIAARFGVHPSTVSLIKSKKRWRILHD